MISHEVSVVLLVFAVVAFAGAAVIHFKFRNTHPTQAHYSNLLAVLGFVSFTMSMLFVILR